MTVEMSQTSQNGRAVRPPGPVQIATAPRDGLFTLDYDVATHFPDPGPSSGGPTVTDGQERDRTSRKAEI